MEQSYKNTEHNSNAFNCINISLFFPLYNLASKEAVKVLLIGIGLLFLEQFSGVYALLFFVTTVFKLSGSSLSPESSSIIVGIVQLIGAFASTFLVDKTGRRFLISLSAFGIASGMLIFYLHGSLLVDISSNFNWIPLASLSFVFLISNFGVLTLPFLVMSELMITLPKVRQHYNLKFQHKFLTYENFDFNTDPKYFIYILSHVILDICIYNSQIFTICD